MITDLLRLTTMAFCELAPNYNGLKTCSKVGVEWTVS